MQEKQPLVEFIYPRRWFMEGDKQYAERPESENNKRSVSSQAFEL